MIHMELSTEHRTATALQEAVRQVSDGQQMVLTANGFELAAMIPMGDLDLQSKGAELPERAETLADFL